MELINTKNLHDLTMTSLEVAELTGKRHDHVVRDIRKMLTEIHGVGGVPKFEDTYLNNQNGQSYPMFTLPKTELMTLLTGYDVVARYKVIQRCEYLEALHEEAMSLRISVVESALGITTALLQSENSECFRDSAKIIGVKETDLINLMLKQKWLYRRANGRLCATARAAQRGLIEEKFVTLDSGTEVVARTLLLPKGMHELRKLLSSKDV